MSEAGPNQTSENEEKVEAAGEHRLPAVIEAFLQNVEGLNSALPLVMFLMTGAGRLADKHLKEYLDQHGSYVEEQEEARIYTLPLDKYQEGRRLERGQERALSGLRLIPRAFLIALVSQYDSFLSRLLRALFLLRPELLSATDR